MKNARYYVVIQSRMYYFCSLYFNISSTLMDHLITPHPLQPFLPKGAKVLLLGSFPPKSQRWSMDFYYPNIQNDMWRIMGLVFYNDKDYFIVGNKFEEVCIREFCTQKGIAIGDTAKAVIRLNDNAADRFLDIVEHTDLDALLKQIPNCHTIITTGQKATDALLSIMPAMEPKIGSYSEFRYHDRTLKLYRMPSTSRAYPKPLHEKASVYRKMFEEIDLLL